MIPSLAAEDGLLADYRAYLEELRSRGFSGEIRTDYATRLVTSTDNSVYQLVPQAVLYPKSELDVVRALRLLAEDRFEHLKVSPRGGGTGTNGQSLCDGIIIDVSRHLRRILETNVSEGWVTIEPGVVLDQLNTHLKPEGVFFAPNLSPSSRATIGGMINTDACGKGSRIYGKTSNHVVELDVVLVDGTRWTSRELSLEELAKVKERDDLVGHIHRVVDDIVTGKADRIASEFPKLKRFLTGYNLAHVYNADRTRFNLNYILAGSEGTLAFLTRARLKLTPLPKYKQLVAVRYGEFDAALRAANVLVSSDPGAIETVDDTIVGIARNDAIWDKIEHLVTGDDEPPMAAINLVEFESHDEAVVETKVAELTATLDAERGTPGKSIGYTVATEAGDIASLWSLRKKGVGLLGAAKGVRRPIAFVEDTAVPPERLADYIREFRALLDGHGLRYGMFGHVDVGCLHVRPALNLRDPEDEVRLREISDQVVRLVKKYGGVMWAEHGKGFRSEYSPVFFGPELYEELRKVKAAFDPRNQLNPGKLATPAGSKDKLVSVDALKRGAYDRQIGAEALAAYDVTVNCNGNGACFDWNPNSVMCPSSKITADRIHSPKGRAGIMREWLRQLTRAGYDPAVPAHQRNRDPAEWVASLTTGREAIPEDFSHEVYDAMSGCLACKACATQCPIKVDVPEFRSRFLDLYHSRYRRPLKDYFFASLEKVVGLMAVFPSLTNRMFKARWFSELLRRVVGIVDTPLVAEKTLAAGLRERNAPVYDPRALARLSPTDKARYVLIARDAFTAYYEPNVVLATYDLLVELGFKPVVLPFWENGKGLHVKGFLSSFRRTVNRTAKRLEEAAATGIPIVGLDPAVTLTYRDEYASVLGTEDLPFKVQLVQEWLVEQVDTVEEALEERGFDPTGEKYQLFGHCTERTAAARSQKDWAAVFEAFGLKLDMVDVGCCGMCGAYGHEEAHRAESKGIFELSWGRQLPKTASGRTHVVATGHSCRSQVKRFGGFVPLHPAEALHQVLSSTRRSLTNLPRA